MVLLRQHPVFITASHMEPSSFCFLQLESGSNNIAHISTPGECIAFR